MMSVPALRFSEFSKDLTTKSLREVSLLITKGTTPKTFTEEGINFIKIECFENNRINSSKCSFIDEETHQKDLKRSILEEGDILFAIAGATIGKCQVVTKDVLPANTNQALAIIRLDGTEHPNFIYHVLRSQKMQKYIVDNISVGAQPNLNLQQIGDFSLTLPEFFEQTKIADFLTAVDEKISQLTQKHELLNEYKKGVMRKIFSQELRFKDDDGSEFPEWDIQPLKEISTIIMGSSPSSNSYNEDGIGLPLIQGNADIKERLSAPRIFTSQITKECHEGDLLLSVRAPVGTIAISRHNACIGRGIASIRAKSNILQGYLYQSLLELEPKWKSLSQGSTFEAVNSDEIKNIEISLPSIKEQTKIANFLTTIDDKITATQSQLELVKQYKQGLLQQMFV